MRHTTIEEKLERLEQQVAGLVALCEKLRQENRSLREQQDGLVEERARLIEKNEMARSKVEQMISRLKSLEANQ